MGKFKMDTVSVCKPLLAAVFMIAASAGAASAQVGDPDAGKKVFRTCAACHSVAESGKSGVGPNLRSVFGRAAGSHEGYKYGKSLAEANGKGLVWDEEQLFNWLNGPKDFLRAYLDDPKAKSKMPLKLANEQKRRDVIAYLKSLGGDQAKASDGQAEQAKTAEMSHGDTPFDTAQMKSADKSDGTTNLERVRQKLVNPPFVPEHDQVAKGGPKVIEVELVVEEKKWVLDGDGTQIVALTFNGSIPAPLIVAHEGDYVEVTLKNPATNVMEHNIDLHAATGALGGAGVTTISPGEEAVLRFKATKTGVFLYHCAPEGSMTPYHVTHGMTGAIMILPRDGLKDDQGKQLKYDRAYYVGENDFYVPRDEDGNFKKYETAGEDLGDWITSMKTLTPSHVVFNGRVGALTGQGAMKANVGETVLFLHVQGNRDTRPHLIGGHGDYVWETGSFASPPMKDLETWFVRGGSAGAALYTFRQPGVYAYLNHNLIEAVELGAAAHVVVEGKWNDDLMKQVYIGPIK